MPVEIRASRVPQAPLRCRHDYIPKRATLPVGACAHCAWEDMTQSVGARQAEQELPLRRNSYRRMQPAPDDAFFRCDIAHSMANGSSKTSIL
jgi:hypothetical protein